MSDISDAVLETGLFKPTGTNGFFTKSGSNWGVPWESGEGLWVEDTPEEPSITLWLPQSESDNVERGRRLAAFWTTMYDAGFRTELSVSSTSIVNRYLIEEVRVKKPATGECATVFIFTDNVKLVFGDTRP